MVDVRERGYGAAIMGAVSAARGRFIVMGDSDGSDDFTALEPFLDKLREGCQRSPETAYYGKLAIIRVMESDAIR